MTKEQQAFMKALEQYKQAKQLADDGINFFKTYAAISDYDPEKAIMICVELVSKCRDRLIIKYNRLDANDPLRTWHMANILGAKDE